MDVEAQVRAARLRAVFDRLGVTLAITVVSGIAVAAVLSADGASWAVWAWLGLVVALAALRLAAWLAWRRDEGATPARWERVAIGGALASGLLWGAGAALLPMGAGAGPAWLGPMVLALLLGAMAAGAATVHAVHATAALAFLVPATALAALRLALQGDGPHLLLAACVLAGGALLCVVARRSARQFGQTLRLQIELAHRSEALDRSNAALSAEIENHRATGETLRQAQRMEAIGQLTGGIAHDFNNVLAVIGGNLQLLRRRGEGNPDIQRLAGAAERACERGARLTASLLSFARAQQLRPEEVDLNEMVREVAPMLRRTLGGRMELALELSPGRLAALADPAHFQAALMHLVINARDAGPQGRRLAVATALEPRAGEPALACVRVTDTGPGMAPDVAARAFEPFFTTKEVGKGSGLGLSQVYGFARQSGGTARIETVQGGGTAISILLPALAAPPAPAAAPDPEAEAAFAGRVLLVEDDADVREVLQESLASSGWQVTPAASGAEARQVLEGDAPLDIVVSDVVMPGEVNGVELARAAARLRPELPVLLISGFPNATLAAQGADEAELDLMRKPFTHAELLSRMREARRAGPRPRACAGPARAAGG